MTVIYALAAIGALSVISAVVMFGWVLALDHYRKSAGAAATARRTTTRS